MLAGINGTGLAITKYASAAQRSTIDASKTVLVWMYFLIDGKEKFLFLQFVGFAILLWGTLVYNEIFSINPFSKKS